MTQSLPSMPGEPHTDIDAGADPWAHLRRFTPARIALGRAGASLPTREVLGFGLAHAQARDAIHLPLDVETLAAQLRAEGWPAPLRLHSRAHDRHEYLLRPDLGRRLDEASVAALQAWRADNPAPDLALVVGDGLSALGIQRHAVPLFNAIRHALGGAFVQSPPVLVGQARVAVADEAGELLGARMVAMIVGERPGLSSPDSVGIYLTHAPRVGRHDAERNCISNVRPAGQDPATAARRLAWLVHEGLRLGVTGVGLKDHSGLPMVSAAPAQRVSD
ncbi:ethanolamine ammonia-lyase subunit EutC [Hydrogenophaga sp.]|uniref:ethanolamine ammonia-lyase subunit EutC n=1 Tax=Hydrogenophaga sp. TaxID=1904254 RepID=UPI00286D6E2D|nr:ethanolamine ammonia-lyase subunit EutC [Hydrogenophaga sp.]